MLYYVIDDLSFFLFGERVNMMEEEYGEEF